MVCARVRHSCWSAKPVPRLGLRCVPHSAPECRSTPAVVGGHGGGGEGEGGGGEGEGGGGEGGGGEDEETVHNIAHLGLLVFVSIAPAPLEFAAPAVNSHILSPVFK